MLVYLPLPNSPEDWSAFVTFGTIAAFIAWRVYRTVPKR